jgi:hypothetical protein
MLVRVQTVVHHIVVGFCDTKLSVIVMDDSMQAMTHLTKHCSYKFLYQTCRLHLIE